jgi:hypothetical protein
MRTRALRIAATDPTVLDTDKRRPRRIGGTSFPCNVPNDNWFTPTHMKKAA